MKVESFYDNDSKRYDAKRLTRYFDFLNQSEAEIVASFSQGKDVLEIGCGTGLVMQLLKEKSANIKGVDLSSEMIKKVLEKGLSVQKADAEELPFENNSFDIAYSFKVLSHVPNITKALQEASRVVKNNGHVIVEFYNPFSIKRLTDLLSRRYEQVLTRYDTLSKIKSYLPKELVIEDIRGIRITIAMARLLSVPILSDILIAIERLLSKTYFKYLGSYFVVVCSKKTTKDLERE